MTTAPPPRGYGGQPPGPPPKFVADASFPETCARCGYRIERHRSAIPGDSPETCPTYTYRQLGSRPGSASLGIAIACGALAIPVLVIMLISAHGAADCDSGLGQLGQALDRTTARNCSAANGVHILTILAFVVLALGCLIAAVTHVTGQHPHPASAAGATSPTPPSKPPAPARSPATDDPAARLRQLQELLDAGLVTRDEYDTRRAAIINSI